MGNKIVLGDDLINSSNDNVLKIMEHVLNNGFDPVMGKEVFHVSDFKEALLRLITLYIKEQKLTTVFSQHFTNKEISKFCEKIINLTDEEKKDLDWDDLNIRVDITIDK